MRPEGRAGGGHSAGVVGPRHDRRRVLQLAVAGVVAGACAPAAREVTGPAPPPPPVTVRTRWRDRPDGPLPLYGDEGQPFFFLSPDGATSSIAGGAVVGNLPDRPSAAYLSQDLGTPVRRIGAEFGFGPGSTGASLTLIAWLPGRPLTSPLHVALAPDKWVVAVLEEGELTEIGEGTYGAPLERDGRPHRVDIVLRGSTVTSSLPDGRVVEASDDDVARLAGSIACWEFFREAGDGAQVRLYESWAG